MPDLKVSDKVRLENFIRMTWDDFEELYAVVAPMTVKKNPQNFGQLSAIYLCMYVCMYVCT